MNCYVRWIINSILVAMALLAVNIELEAQNNKYIYRHFESKGVDKVAFDTPAQLEFKKWESDNFLFEYHVKVGNVARNMYLSLLKTNRYNLQLEKTNQELLAFVEKAAFRIFSSSSGQAEENIVLTVYYPEEFDVSNNELQRR